MAIPIGCGRFVLGFMVWFFGVFSSLAIILLRKGELVDLLKLYYDCIFLRGPIGLSVICDCNISRSYLIIF